MRPFKEGVNQDDVWRVTARHPGPTAKYAIKLISFALEILHDSPGTPGLALSGAVVTVIAGAPGNT
jgi:hypothetical protein